MTEADLEHLQQYLIQAVKWITATDGRRYRIPTSLQLFVNDVGAVVMAREA